MLKNKCHLKCIQQNVIEWNNALYIHETEYVKMVEWKTKKQWYTRVDKKIWNACSQTTMQILLTRKESICTKFITVKWHYSVGINGNKRVNKEQSPEQLTQGYD